MLFPTHLLLGYVLARVSDRPLPWVVAGSALPDLVDKPLAAAGIVDLYHTVGHSGIGLVVVVAAALLIRRPELWALAVGVASHLGLDAAHVVLNSRPSDIAFLGWPAVLPPNPPALPPLAFVRVYVGTPSFFIECLIWVVFGSLVADSRLRTRPSG